MCEIRGVLEEAPQKLLPWVDERALRTLKFAELLPTSLAVSTLAERNSDRAGAAAISTRPLASK
jgi:ATP-dependent Lhr-like helicase